MSSLSSVYSSLPAGFHIRLVELMPETSSAPLSLKFIVASIDNTEKNRYVQFEALSYMWGNSKDTPSTISVDGHPFLVTRRLESILRDLRDTARVRRLWIDALCINQTDIQERNSQVQLMRRIYQQAQTVLVWLDQELDLAQEVLQKLRLITEDSKPEDLGDSPSFWGPLNGVFKDPYWSRVWIQQEISNASSLKLLCKGVELDIYSVFHLLRLFDEVIYQDIMGPSWWDWAIEKPSVQLPRRFGFRDPQFRPKEGSTIGPNANLDLIGVLSRINNLQCTDERDRVYGTMFLAADCVEGDIPVDYALTVPQVYTKAAEAIVTKYLSTQILLFASLDYSSMPQLMDKTPTWVPDWRRPPCRPSMKRSLGRLVPPAKNDRILQANTTPSFSNGTMSVLAVKVDTVSKFYLDLFTNDVLSMSISEFVGICVTMTRDAISVKGEEETIPPSIETTTIVHAGVEDTEPWRAVLRTLGGHDNRDLEKHPTFAQILYQGGQELLSLCRLNDNGFNPSTIKLGKILNTQTDSGGEDFMKFARAFISFAWWLLIKHFPFLSESGRPGLAPRCCEPGDEVWLVAGCELPVMLRPCALHRYMVVGEAYLDGANFWEPLQVESAPAELTEGQAVNGHTVRTICLI